MPLILTPNNNETEFIYISSPVDNDKHKHSKRDYHYFCPLENENDFELKESLLVCKDSQCLFHKTTIDFYDQKIRCNNEIILEMQPVRNYCQNCDISNNIISVGVRVSKKYKLMAFNTNFTYTQKLNSRRN